jgi:hypothetical protein
VDITSQHIGDYLNGRDDFELELFAYRNLLGNGWSSRVGGTYIDRYTKKPRQFDVRAQTKLTPHCYVSLAVECKSLSPESPLIISRIPRPKDEAVGHDLIARWKVPDNVFGASVLEKMHGHVVVERCPSDGRQLYKVGDMVGKAATQIRYQENKKEFAASDAETYDKWSQALASAAGLIEIASTSTQSDQLPIVTFVMPLLLVNDKTLWVVDYDENGGRKAPEPADEALLYVAREHDFLVHLTNLTYTMSHLHVCTRTGFINLLRDFGRDGKMFDRIFSSFARAHTVILTG